MGYIVQLENFQGPFDVLLGLLDNQELEITDLSLGKITQDYLEYIKELDLNIEEMSWFLFVAAKLVFSKSNKVLNTYIQTEDESENQDLTESLKQYARVKALAAKLALASKTPLYTRPTGKQSNLNLTIELPMLFEALKLALKKDFSKKDHTVNSRLDQIEKVRVSFISNIQKLKKFSSQDIINNSSSRPEAIICFLAILDFVKKGQLSVSKNNLQLTGASL